MYLTKSVDHENEVKVSWHHDQCVDQVWRV